MKLWVPSLNVSLERGTEDVPRDGQYHVVRDGRIVKSFRSEKAALRLYRALIEELGGYPKSEQPTLTAEERKKILIRESINKRLDLAEDYWGTAGTKHKGKKYTW